MITQNNDVEYAGSYATVAIDNGFEPVRFEEQLSFDIRSLDATSMEVEIFGFDAPLANTLRRVIISEVNSNLTLDSYDSHRQGNNVLEHFNHPR